MSKYYKAEDAINKVAEYISIDYSREERAREDAELLFADLPTIEVSEEQLSKLNICEYYCKGYCSKYDDGCFHQCVQKQVSDDCISRTTALEIYSELYWIDERLLNFKDELDKVYEKLRTTPCVVPKEKEGEWIEDNLGTVICSECQRPRRDNRVNHTKFCNSCGSKMKGAEE